MRLFSHVWGHIVFFLKHFTYQQRWDTLAVRAVDVMKFDLQVKKRNHTIRKYEMREKKTRNSIFIITFVMSFISFIRILYQKLPVIRCNIFERIPRIAAVRVTAKSYQIEFIAFPSHPWHLQWEKKTCMSDEEEKTIYMSIKILTRKNIYKQNFTSHHTFKQLPQKMKFQTNSDVFSAQLLVAQKQW